jgi:hypothetical protein
MIEQLNKYKIPIYSSIAGALLGFLYWKLIGCSNDTCTIQSVWYNSTLYGALMGYLISDLFKKD